MLFAESFLSWLRNLEPTTIYTAIFVGITFFVYLGIGWYSRVAESKGFYVAGQGVPAIANGAATAADWMSAASFMGMAGAISILGSDGSVFLMGWTGGYVLLALLLAPYLRKFGKYTVPDFVGERYYSETARIVAAVCAIFISLTYVAGQMRGVGIVFSRFLEVPAWLGAVVGMVIVASSATPVITRITASLPLWSPLHLLRPAVCHTASWANISFSAAISPAANAWKPSMTTCAFGCISTPPVAGRRVRPDT